VILVVACAGVATQFGCKEDDQIRTYRIRKPSRVNEPTADQPQDRLLAAIVPHGTRTWFFKVTGRAGALDEHIDVFRTFVKSVRFSDGEDSAPTWTLPPGWQQQPASGMRFATLHLGTEKERFELTVIPLPSPPQDAAVYTLSNINRWRRQLGLSPLSAQEVAGQTERLSLDGAAATMVSILGHLDKTTMMSPHSAADRQAAGR
jgi:hypothetical protein